MISTTRASDDAWGLGMYFFAFSSEKKQFCNFFPKWSRLGNINRSIDKTLNSIVYANLETLHPRRTTDQIVFISSSRCQHCLDLPTSRPPALPSRRHAILPLFYCSFHPLYLPIRGGSMTIPSPSSHHHTCVRNSVIVVPVIFGIHIEAQVEYILWEQCWHIWLFSSAYFSQWRLVQFP